MLPIRRTMLSLALSATLVPAAHAQINLAWNNCLGETGAEENQNYACDGSRSGTFFKLVASVVPPTTLTTFNAAEMYFDIAGTSIDDLPDWWRLGIGECRDENLFFPSSLTGVGTGTTGTCRNPWKGTTGGGYDIDYTWAGHRYWLATAFASDNVTTLTQGQHYLLGVIRLGSEGDVPSGSHPTPCQGCCQPLTIVLATVVLYDYEYPFSHVLNTPAVRQSVTWQASGNCVPTATRRGSWGGIKATYR